MLIPALIFLGVALIAGLWSVNRAESTLTLIAKVIFYIFLMTAFALLIIYFFSSVPPIPDNNKMLL